MRAMTMPQLNVAIYKELSKIADNEHKMQKALMSLRQIRREKQPDEHGSDKYIRELLVEAGKDVRRIKDGEMTGHPVGELLESL